MDVALLDESSALDEKDAEVSPNPDDDFTPAGYLTTPESARTKEEEVPRRLGSCGLLFYVTVGSACVLGNLLSYLMDAGWPVLAWYQTVTCATLPLLAALSLLLFRNRDPSARTWHQQYCNRRGQSTVAPCCIH